jgi:hypothetical protein
MQERAAARYIRGHLSLFDQALAASTARLADSGTAL